jgi:Holliday junction resolvase RusA-like endonuclease
MAQFLLTVPLVPVPASRPRFSRFGKPYYGKNYTAFRKDATRYLESELFKDAIEQSGIRFPLLGSLRLKAVYIVGKPKTSKREWPVGDVDNYLKTLDVFNGILWQDDDQITVMEGRKVWGNPQIHLAIEYDEEQQIRQTRAVPKVRLKGQPLKVR